MDVLADAQKDKFYVEHFHRDSATATWRSRSPLAIVPFAEWSASLVAGTWVTGPGLEMLAPRLPANVSVVPADDWNPRSKSLLCLGLEKLKLGKRDDSFALEPIYLRPSSAEEQWQRLAETARD